MSASSTTFNAVENLNPLPAGTRLQEFVIERTIGVGGFGIVYQANDTLLNRTVAIKEYMPTSLASRSGAETVSPRSVSFAQDFESGKAAFIDEARMLARFKHPALIEVFRFWEQNSTAYMAMPFYKGQTLKERLRLNPGVPHEAELKMILMPVLDALEHMHREQVYHRDISPDNIMVTEDGTPILLDLGAARRIEEHNAQAFTVLVKPGYAPIEQYAGDAVSLQGPWTDLYGWGASAYFALAGKPPPPAASRVMNDSIGKLVDLKPAGYSHDMLAAIDATLAVRPDDRPQSVADLKILLAIETPANLIPLARPSSRPHTEESAPSASSMASGIANAFEPNDSVSKSGSTSASRVGPAARVVEPVEMGAQPETSNADSDQATGKGNRRLAGVAIAVTVIVAATMWFVSRESPRAVAIVPEAQKALPATSADAPAAEVKPEASSAAPTSAALTDAVVIDKPATARFAIKPWGEILVNGARRGVSPPLKALSLPAGEYAIEVRNGDYAPYKTKIKLAHGQVVRINYAFVDAGKQ